MGFGATLYATLSKKYPAATRNEVLVAVTHAVQGARLMGLDRRDPTILRAAEHELRLALGLEEDMARTDPERHSGDKGHKGDRK